jgi:hypothetical protein
MGAFNIVSVGSISASKFISTTSTDTATSTNTGALNFYEPTPVLSLAPGFYPGAQTVTITCANPSASIRYTTNGSNPTTTSTFWTGFTCDPKKEKKYRLEHFEFFEHFDLQSLTSIFFYYKNRM